MQDKLLKYSQFYYLISIFLMANGGFANYVCDKFLLTTWRQLIFLIGLVIINTYLSYINTQRLNEIFHRLKYLFGIIVILSILTYVFKSFNLVRIVFTWWQYFAGIPFVLFPFIARCNRWSIHKLNYFFIFLGVFQTIGLIMDYSTGGLFTNMFKAAGEETTEQFLENGRYCFLSEAPTTFGVYYSLCLAMTMREAVTATSLFKKTFLLLCSCSYVIGGWFTGSRQIVFVLIIVFIVGMLFLIVDNVRNVLPIILFAIIGGYVSSRLTKNLYEDEIYENRYSVESMREDSRYQAWKDGAQYCLWDGDVKRILIGEGVGLLGLKAIHGEEIGRHYENSYWARMSETGLIGLYILLFPLFVMLRELKLKDSNDMLLLAFMFSYIITSYVSPNGIGQTAQMSIYLALGFFIINKDDKDRLLS